MSHERRDDPGSGPLRPRPAVPVLLRLRTGTRLSVLATSDSAMRVESYVRLLPGRRVELLAGHGHATTSLIGTVVTSRVCHIDAVRGVRYDVLIQIEPGSDDPAHGPQGPRGELRTRRRPAAAS
jgi:hypothetical protein